MKRTRFTETQIVAILKEADSGILIKDICRKHGSRGEKIVRKEWKAEMKLIEIIL